jgi:hypothetical protein
VAVQELQALHLLLLELLIQAVVVAEQEQVELPLMVVLEL